MGIEQRQVSPASLLRVSTLITCVGRDIHDGMIEYSLQLDKCLSKFEIMRNAAITSSHGLSTLKTPDQLEPCMICAKITFR